MIALRRALVLFLLCQAILAWSATKKPCAKSLSGCPTRDCAKEDSSDALANIAKHNLDPKGDVTTLTFDDFRKLQDQVEQKFDGKYSTLNKPDRARLRNLSAGGKTIGEGAFVEILAFVAVKPGDSHPHANTSGESVNCRLPKSPNNDFHISLTPKSGGTEFDGIVAEMIPQDREDAWTEAILKKVQQAKLLVRVRGQLFFDNHHKINDDASHNISNQPKRFSLWEIHPITEFDVCTKGGCTAEGSGWTKLENWQGGQ